MLTDGAGAALGVVGISPSSVDLMLSVGGAVTKGKVEPNCEYALDGEGGLKLTRQVAFKPLAPTPTL